jgi:hypothetical protein
MLGAVPSGLLALYPLFLREVNFSCSPRALYFVYMPQGASKWQRHSAAALRSPEEESGGGGPEANISPDPFAGLAFALDESQLGLFDDFPWDILGEGRPTAERASTQAAAGGMEECGGMEEASVRQASASRFGARTHARDADNLLPLLP